MTRIVTTADQLVNIDLPFAVVKVNGAPIDPVEVAAVRTDGPVRILLDRPRTEWAPPYALAVTDLVTVRPL